jgi:hypothetical protein
MRPTSAEGFRSEADGMPRTHGPWPSIAASRTAARSRVRQVACLVRRPTGWRPEPCTADPRHPYPVSRSATALQLLTGASASPADRATGDGHPLGRA